MPRRRVQHARGASWIWPTHGPNDHAMAQAPSEVARVVRLSMGPRTYYRIPPNVVVVHAWNTWVVEEADWWRRWAVAR